MEKIFNNISLAIGSVGGLIIGILGGWDILLQGLIIAIIIDYITGVLKAINRKELSSEIGRKGIIKKFMYLLIVALSVMLESVLGTEIIRSSVILFFIANEGISICENAAEFIPLPEKLKEILIQLRESKKADDVDDTTK